MGPKKKPLGELERCGKLISVPVSYMFLRGNNLIGGLPDRLGIHGPGKKSPGFFFRAPNQNRGLFFGPPCITYGLKILPSFFPLDRSVRVLWEVAKGLWSARTAFSLFHPSLCGWGDSVT